MGIPFPSLAFFQALQQRTKDEAAAFEKLGYCDTTFGVRVGDELFRVAFEVYECVEVAAGGNAADARFRAERAGRPVAGDAGRRSRPTAAPTARTRSTR